MAQLERVVLAGRDAHHVQHRVARVLQALRAVPGDVAPPARRGAVRHGAQRVVPRENQRLLLHEHGVGGAEAVQVGGVIVRVRVVLAEGEELLKHPGGVVPVRQQGRHGRDHVLIGDAEPAALGALFGRAHLDARDLRQRATRQPRRGHPLLLCQQRVRRAFADPLDVLEHAVPPREHD
eukprot:3023774-Rhodomonas_salina.1